eukprot:489241-Pleurochrysis_carterae.AAC.3
MPMLLLQTAASASASLCMRPALLTIHRRRPRMTRSPRPSGAWWCASECATSSRRSWRRKPTRRVRSS